MEREMAEEVMPKVRLEAGVVAELRAAGVFP